MVLRAMEAKLKEYAGQYDAIGISTAGQVNSKKGEIVFATETIPGYTGVKIKELIETKGFYLHGAKGEHHVDFKCYHEVEEFGDEKFDIIIIATVTKKGTL